MDHCLLCSLRNNYPICIKCRVNPFKVERCRQILTGKNDLITVKKMYGSSWSEIKDLNTSNFWDNKLNKAQLLKDQDGMTKDRIRIASQFLTSDAKKIFDIASGHGFLEEILSRKDVELYGCDISSEAIKNLNKRFKGNFTVESVYKLSYPSSFFDIVFALEILEHIPPSKIFLVLNNIKKVLKKNGNLIVSVPINEGLERMKDNPSGHVRNYTKELILVELRMAGFEIRDVKTLYAFENLYVMKKIIAKIFSNKWEPNNIIIKVQKI